MLLDNQTLRQEIRVLIETYWNVKYIQEINFCKPTQVLIETYWNVKDRIRCQEVVQPRSINRNILECKGIPLRSLHPLLFSY